MIWRPSTLSCEYIERKGMCSDCGALTHWRFRCGPFLSWRRCRKSQTLHERRLARRLFPFKNSGLGAVENIFFRIDELKEFVFVHTSVSFGNLKNGSVSDDHEVMTEVMRKQVWCDVENAHVSQIDTEGAGVVRTSHRPIMPMKQLHTHASLLRHFSFRGIIS